MADTRTTSKNERSLLEPRILESLRRVLANMNVATRDIHLEARLDQDLGLDSITRLELASRLQSDLNVALGAADIQGIATVRDLVDAVGRAPAIEGASSAPARSATPALRSVLRMPPAPLATLIDVLEWHKDRHPEVVHVTLLGNEPAQELTYRDLWERASRAASGLAAIGLRPGDAAALMLPTSLDYLVAFFGILLAGGVPVPIYPPLRLLQLDDHLARQALILENAGARILLASPETAPAARMLRPRISDLKHVRTVGELLTSEPSGGPRPASADSLALLQYTSGSTGQPKGVMLTHQNMLDNIRALGKAIDVRDGDVFVSWLPLYHDLGLIGAWLGCLYFGVPLVLMSPVDFLLHPSRWLQAIARYRGTISGAPNFAYDVCCKRISDLDIEGVDLKSWRLAFCGAEPVIPATLHAFAQRFEPHGLRRDALLPVYGLAEATLGLTIPPLGRVPLIDTIDRRIMARAGLATPVEPGTSNGLQIPSCGLPLPGHQIRIVDEHGSELEDRREGRLQFKGPSATQGYYRNTAATQGLRQGEWLNTGDRAYIARGELFITGRVKDIVIRAGQHLYPEEIEAAVGEVAFVRQGCVAVFGREDPATGTEQLIVMAETPEAWLESEALRGQINERIVRQVGEPADVIALVPPNSVLKTASGKIRRDACRAMFEATHGRIRSPSRRQVIFGIARNAAITTFHGALRTFSRWLYGAIFWAIFVLVAAITWPLSLLCPTQDMAWRFAHAMLHLFLGAMRVPLSIQGLENLPTGGCVVVSNHTSYLDSLFYLASLPRRLDMVVKRELEKNPWASPFLKRIGAQFIDRADPVAGVEGADRLTALAQAGHSFLIFPEGTFTRVPMLMPFRLGAFKVAVEAGLPVIPCAIVGARSALRDGQWWPRRLPVSIQIGEPLLPGGGSDRFAEASALRDRAYAYIAERCGEPRAVPGAVVAS